MKHMITLLSFCSVLVLTSCGPYEPGKLYLKDNKYWIENTSFQDHCEFRVKKSWVNADGKPDSTFLDFGLDPHQEAIVGDVYGEDENHRIIKYHYVITKHLFIRNEY